MPPCLKLCMYIWSGLRPNGLLVCSVIAPQRYRNLEIFIAKGSPSRVRLIPTGPDLLSTEATETETRVCMWHVRTAPHTSRITFSFFFFFCVGLRPIPAGNTRVSVDVAGRTADEGYQTDGVLVRGPPGENHVLRPTFLGIRRSIFR